MTFDRTPALSNTILMTAWWMKTGTPEKDVMASINQTPGGYEFTRHLGLVNKGERTSTDPLALGNPLLGPSRHFRAYDSMP